MPAEVAAAQAGGLAGGKLDASTPDAGAAVKTEAKVPRTLLNFPEPAVDYIRTQHDKQFPQLCDAVMSHMSQLDTGFAELWHWKDILLDSMLPPNALVCLAACFARVQRYNADLHTSSLELVRLVRMYQEPWNKKGSQLSRLLEEHERLKGQLNITLHQFQRENTMSFKLKHEKIVMNWERLYIRVCQSQRHGRRWKYLIGRFKSRAKRTASTNGYIVNDDSTGDDESDDEDNERERPLPNKGSGKIVGGGGYGAAAKQSKQDEEDEEEMILRSKIKSLEDKIDDILTVLPQSHVETQTEPVTQEELDAFDLGQEDLVDPLAERLRLGVGVVDSSGWAGAVPSDLYCQMEVMSPANEGSVCKDTGTTELPAGVDPSGNLVIWQQSIELLNARPTDMVVVTLCAGLRGTPMATAKVPAALFLESKENAVDIDIEGIKTAKARTVVRSTIDIPLSATDGYFDFRQQAAPDLLIGPKVKPRLRFFGRFYAEEEWNEAQSRFADMQKEATQIGEREDEAGVRGKRFSTVTGHHGTSTSTPDHNARTRRTSANIQTAMDKDGHKRGDAFRGDISKTVFDVMDPMEDVEEETFSMQEVMELAVLHEKQMQMMEQEYEKQLEETLKLLQGPPMEDFFCQVDTEPDVVEKEVVKEVEKVVVQERVVEVIKEVPKIIEKIVEKIIEKIVTEIKVEEKIVIKWKTKKPEPAPADPNQFAFDGPKKSTKKVAQTFTTRDPSLDDSPQGFFDRLRFFAERKNKNLNHLIARIEAMVKYQIEGQMHGRRVHARENKRLEEDTGEMLPTCNAMPNRGAIYSPRAVMSFHPTGSKYLLRRTQPPTMINTRNTDGFLPSLTKSQDVSSPVNLYEMATGTPEKGQRDDHTGTYSREHSKNQAPATFRNTIRKGPLKDRSVPTDERLTVSATTMPLTNSLGVAFSSPMRMDPADLERLDKLDRDAYGVERTEE